MLDVATFIISLLALLFFEGFFSSNDRTNNRKYV